MAEEERTTQANGCHFTAETSIDNVEALRSGAASPGGRHQEMIPHMLSGAMYDTHHHFETRKNRRLPDEEEQQDQEEERVGWFSAAVTSIPVAVLSYSTCLSYAQLIVAGTPVNATVVTAMLLIGAGITSLILPWRSACPIVVFSADISSTLFFKKVLADIMAVEEASDTVKIATALVAMPLATLFMSLVFVAVGRMKVSLLVAYLPFPVIAGFLGSIGQAIFLGSFAVLTGHPITSLDDVSDMAESFPAQLGSAVAMVAIVTVVQRLKLVPPSVLAVAPMTCGFIFFWSWALATGKTIDDLRDSNWLFRGSKAVPAATPWTEGSIADVDLGLLMPVPSTYIGFGIIGLLSLTLRVASIEGFTGKLMDVDQELEGTGLLNILVGFLGGVAGSQSPGLTAFNKQAGSLDRKPGAIAAVIQIVLWLSGIPVMDILPRFVLCGILMNLGAVMLVEWLWSSRRKAGFLGSIVIYAQVAGAVVLGLMPSVIIGISVACFTAKVQEMKLSVLKYHLSGVTVHSNVHRPPNERLALDGLMHQIEVIGLEGYLTEGPVAKFSRYLVSYIKRNPDVRYMIFDFGACQGPNASSASQLTKLEKILRSAHVTTIFISMPPGLEGWLEEFGVNMSSRARFETMHRALEHCENMIIRKGGVDVQGRRRSLDVASQQQQQKDGSSAEAFTAALAEMLGGDADIAAVLEKNGTWVSHEAGAKLACQGEMPHQMHFAIPYHSEVCELIDIGSCQVAAEKISVHKLGFICGGESLLWAEPARTAVLVSAPGSLILAVTMQSMQDLIQESQALALTITRVMAEQLLRRTDALGQEVEFYKGGGWRGANFDKQTAEVMASIPKSPALPRTSYTSRNLDEAEQQVLRQRSRGSRKRGEAAGEGQQWNLPTMSSLSRMATIDSWASEWMQNHSQQGLGEQLLPRNAN